MYSIQQNDAIIVLFEANAKKRFISKVESLWNVMKESNDQLTSSLGPLFLTIINQNYVLNIYVDKDQTYFLSFCWQ
jgi:hypothetical protein